MTAQVLFNQFAYTDRLKAGGFTDEQARASADALGAALTETVATSSELAAVETRLDAKIDSVETRLEAKIDSVETRLDAKIDTSVSRLETKIAESTSTLIKWFVGIALTMTGIVSGAVWTIVKFVH